MLFNASYITDRVVLITTVDAEDESDAHNLGVETIAEELGINLISDRVRYQIEIERVH